MCGTKAPDPPKETQSKDLRILLSRDQYENRQGTSRGTTSGVTGRGSGGGGVFTHSMGNQVLDQMRVLNGGLTIGK